MDQLRTFTFGKGSHPSREDGLCVMEAVAMLAGERHTDTPDCADPVITKLAIWVNDSCNDQLRNELLLGMPWRIVGTKSTPEIEQQRAFMAADWAVRFVCPILLRRAGLAVEAAKLEQQPQVNDKKSAWAAEAAAEAAAWAAAKAAWAAAWAAKAAAEAAAWAAKAAAEAAAEAAAKAAAGDLETIQLSCVELIDRMIRLTEPQESACRQARLAKCLAK